MSFDPSKKIASALGLGGSTTSVERSDGRPALGGTLGEPRGRYGCPTTAAMGSNASIYRKNFLDNLLATDSVRKLAGPVGDGLSSLVRASDILRVGGNGSGEDSGTLSALSKIANIAADNVQDGANAVLDAVGLGGIGQLIGDINPKAVNSATSAAGGLFQKIKSGNLGFSDLPTLAAEFTNVHGIINSAMQGPKGQVIQTKKAIQLCGASPYAMDLVNAAPKHKFLYILDIDFHDAYTDWNDIGKSMAFSTKRTTRPQIDFEYEEINMYNFRTRVAKRTTYAPMNMTFHDDQTNNSHLFYTAYLRAMSPISNIRTSAEFNYIAQYGGMDFTKEATDKTFSADDRTPTRGYSASLGTLNQQHISLIKEIRLYHVFNYGKLMNVYHFHNPRITQMTPSELSMAETGEGSEYEFQFVYDGIWVSPAVDIQKEIQTSSMGDAYRIDTISGNAGRATYPLNPVFGPDYDVKDMVQYNAPTFQEQDGRSVGGPVSQGRGDPRMFGGSFSDYKIPGFSSDGSADMLNSAIAQANQVAAPYIEDFNTLKSTLGKYF